LRESRNVASPQKGPNSRHERFIVEYLKDGNAMRSAIAAGYPANRARQTGCELLRKPEIAAKVAKKQEKQLKKLEITAEKTLEEIARLAFANMLDYMKVNENGQADVDLSNITREQAAAIQEISVDTSGGSGDGERRQVLRTKFKLTDKRGSLELLARHFKMLTDRVEVSGLDGLADAIAKARQRAAAAKK
jgi:phage terminase small subunit